MNFTTLRSKTVVLTLALTFILPAARICAGWRLAALGETIDPRGRSLVFYDLSAKRCTIRPTAIERIPLLYSAVGLRADSMARREIPLRLSSPTNSLVRVSWPSRRLSSESCIVAYSLLGYEYLRLNVHEGSIAAFIDTRQLLSGIYVLRLETRDGESLGYTRLVVAHPLEVNARN